MPHYLCTTIYAPLSMHHYLCVSMPYGPFFGDTDFPLRAARPSSGEQPGVLRCRAGTWSETGRKPFSFFTLNITASGVHTKRETSSSPESRKLNELTAWGPPQSCVCTFLLSQLLVLISYLCVGNFLLLLMFDFTDGLFHFIIFMFLVVAFSFLLREFPLTQLIKLVW